LLITALWILLPPYEISVISLIFIKMLWLILAKRKGSSTSSKYLSGLLQQNFVPSLKNTSHTVLSQTMYMIFSTLICLILQSDFMIINLLEFKTTKFLQAAERPSPDPPRQYYKKKNVGILSLAPTLHGLRIANICKIEQRESPRVCMFKTICKTQTSTIAFFDRCFKVSEVLKRQRKTSVNVFLSISWF